MSKGLLQVNLDQEYISIGIFYVVTCKWGGGGGGGAQIITNCNTYQQTLVGDNITKPIKQYKTLHYMRCDIIITL